MKPAALKKPSASTSREIRLENSLREVKDQVDYALDEEEIITLNFESKNLTMGIFIGVVSGGIFIWIAMNIGLIHCGLTLGALLPF